MVAMRKYFAQEDIELLVNQLADYIDLKFVKDLLFTVDLPSVELT